MKHLSTAELEAGLSYVRDSPSDAGMVVLIARRPAVDERDVLTEATLDLEAGLTGDSWRVRASSRTADGSPHPGMQVTMMNSRAALLIAHDPDRRVLAGDQLYADLDLSPANLPPGMRLAVGSAVLEVTDQPHLGCAKFAARFGQDALRFVNSRVGRELRLRGLNARVVVPGTVRTGDPILKCAAPTRQPRRGRRAVGPGCWPVAAVSPFSARQVQVVLPRQRRPGRFIWDHNSRSGGWAHEGPARDEACLPASRCPATAAAFRKDRASQWIN